MDWLVHLRQQFGYALSEPPPQVVPLGCGNVGPLAGGVGWADGVASCSSYFLQLMGERAGGPGGGG